MFIFLSRCCSACLCVLVRQDQVDRRLALLSSDDARCRFSKKCPLDIYCRTSRLYTRIDPSALSQARCRLLQRPKYPTESLAAQGAYCENVKPVSWINPRPPFRRHTYIAFRFSRPDARDDLFSSYNRSASPSKNKHKSRSSPYNAGTGYGYAPPPSDANGPSFGAYPGSSGNGTLYPGSSSGTGRSVDGTYRSVTPNSRGQYSAAVLDELESQNDEQVGVLTSKVKMLKDVLDPMSPSFLHR